MDVYIGFDSAWTDNVKAPGAICAVARRGDGYEFIPPRLACFAEAATFIETLTTPQSLVLIALDQPTRVPNHDGGRPVERVAASVISRLGGGVQPARRGGSGASMFGDTAPVWPFLNRLQAIEAPFAARIADEGRYLIEVFPALALPSMIPAIWRRGRAAKYNPAAATYQRGDWPLVCEGAAAFAHALGVAPVASWLMRSAENVTPTKSDQDRLDAVLCVLVAIHWRLGALNASMVIGDTHSGYMVTPVTEQVSAVLRTSASARGVPLNDPDTAIAIAPYAHAHIFTEGSVSIAPPASTAAHVMATRLPGARGPMFRVDADDLRALLVALARTGDLITYGEVAAHFGQPWHQGFGASLKRALNEVGALNRLQGEPDLMGIVVNKETRMPGDGFFVSLGLTAITPAQRLTVHEEQILARQRYDWPDLDMKND